MELLAPAGNREALVAAVQHGADAVYLGFTAFGARSYAGNFDGDGLREAVDYCHERGRRVYVTVNTLVKQGEIPALYDLIALVNRVKADAVIVQDLGVAAIVHACFPDLPLHASTQMALHNARGAAFAREQGIVRVVPARECSVAELALMAGTGVEVEAFVHGALCVSVSGQCLFSSMVGGRSGNRGRCAQPCRLPYREGKSEAYPLSMRDLMTVERLPELAKAGVAALKIEGRMKRPEYVAVVTAVYRRALDALLAGEPYALQEAEREALLQVFHRGGFTCGHLGDARHAELIDASRPNHGGLEMGVISSVRNGLASMTALRPLHDGDGLQIRGQQRRGQQQDENEFTYSGPEIAAGARALLRVTFEVKPGDAVFRLTDAAQMREARFASEGERCRVPVDAVLTAFPDARATLELTDGVHTVAVTAGQLTAQAEKNPLNEAGVRRQMERMGDTPYRLRSLKVWSERAFLPVSALNALRRDALEELSAARKARPERRALPLEKAEKACVGTGDEAEGDKLIAQTQRLADAGALIAAGADAVYWSPADYRVDFLQRAIRDGAQQKIWFVLPPLAWSGELEDLHRWVTASRERFQGVVMTNPGQLALTWGGLLRVADAALHAWNRCAYRAWAGRGCLRATLAPELNAREIGDVLATGGAWEMVVYGRTQLMLLSHCPERVRQGAAACQSCERGHPLPPLVDRKGYAFPLERLRMEHGCQVRLLNSLPTWLPEKHGRALRALAASGRLSWRLCFADETLPQCQALLHRAKALLAGEDAASVKQDAQSGIHDVLASVTSGHFGRGVE